MKRVLLTAPGILTDQNDPLAWFRQYASRFEIQDETEHTGIPYSYFADVAGAPPSLDSMADSIAGIIAPYISNGWHVDAVGHSHGCPLLLAALSRHAMLNFGTLTLIAAAADVDCDKNGINEIVRRKQVRRIQILYSRNDAVLAGPGTFPGYGQLGLRGPRNVSVEAGRIIETVEFFGGHSDYFNRQNNERTYQLATAGDTESAQSGESGLLSAGDGTPLPTSGGAG
jgi:hypothetical protein